jgi:hypothetical protein
MCLWPRKPWRIRITREGFEHVIRCGECPGCLEFERRRLADRLHAKYGSDPRPLFIVRIWAPLELHASIAHKLHRRRGLELEPGMWRLGASSFAILARGSSPPREALRALGLRFRIEPLRLGRRRRRIARAGSDRGAESTPSLRRPRRAWRALTAGLIVAREIYGEQRNRFYARGLPAAEREKWEVKKLGSYKSYSRSSSPRAWTDRKLVLVPPDVWKLRRADRRSLRGLLIRASDPEGVKRVMGLVAAALAGGHGMETGRSIGSQEMRALAGQGLDSGPISGVDRIRSKVSTGSSDVRLPVNVSAPPKAVRSKRHTAQSYQVIASRIEARTALPDPDQIYTPTSEVGGYVSSEHKQGELMPRELARAREKEWRELRKARLLKESLEIIERMKRKSRGGGDPHD